MATIAYRGEQKTIYATFVLPDGTTPTSVINATIEIRFWDPSASALGLQTIVASTPMTLAEAPNKFIYMWDIDAAATYGTYIAYTTATVENSWNASAAVDGVEEFIVISSSGGGGFNFIDIVSMV